MPKANLRLRAKLYWVNYSHVRCRWVQGLSRTIIAKCWVQKYDESSSVLRCNYGIYLLVLLEGRPCCWDALKPSCQCCTTTSPSSAGQPYPWLLLKFWDPFCSCWLFTLLFVDKQRNWVKRMKRLESFVKNYSRWLRYQCQ